MPSPYQELLVAVCDGPAVHVPPEESVTDSVPGGTLPMPTFSVATSSEPAGGLNEPVAMLPVVLPCEVATAGVEESSEIVHVPPPPPPPLMVQVKLADPLAPVVSVAVTVTLEVPAVVGVPEIRPVDVLMDSPAGRPLAL